MSIEKTAGRDLGKFIGATTLGIAPADVNFASGAIDTHEQDFRKKAHRKVMSFLHKLFVDDGHANTKVAKLLGAMANVDMDHNEAIEQMSNHIFDHVKEAAINKSAGGLLSALPGFAGASAETIMWLLGGASALTGAGAGALKWHADRSVEQDKAENDAKKRKIEYYRNLTNDLKRSMETKYGVS